jgi:hypothetical protein
MASAAATAAVAALLRPALEELRVDASYADFVADAIGGDDGGADAAAETRRTLLEMLALAAEGADGAPADDATQRALAALLERATAAYDAERRAAVHREYERRAAAELAAAAAAAPAAAPAAALTSDAAPGVDGVDSAMKRLIMANYGYEYESDEEDREAAAKAAKAAAKAAGKAAQQGAPTRHASGGGLDDALGQLDDEGRGGADVAGLGRRARRRAEHAGGAPAAAAVAAAAAGGGAGAMAAGDVGGLAAAHAGSGSGARAAGAAAAGGGGGDHPLASTEPAAAAGRSITGRRPKGAKGGGGGGRGGGAGGGDSDSGSEGDGSGGGGGARDGGRPPAAPGRGLVEFDPLAISLNNKEYYKAKLQGERDAERARHEAEAQRVREAAEAARCVPTAGRGEHATPRVRTRVFCCARSLARALTPHTACLLAARNRPAPATRPSSVCCSAAREVAKQKQLLAAAESGKVKRSR